MKIKVNVSNAIPEGTVVAATPDQTAFVKATAKDLASEMGQPVELVERAVWQYLIDKGVVTAIVNLGTEH